MTISNGTVCMHPLANPFNTRLDWSNYTLNPHGKGNPFCKLTIDKKSTTLPEPKPFGAESIPNSQFAQYVGYDEMHLPDTTIHNMRTQTMDKSLFTAPDGTIIDIDKRKVLSSPNRPIRCIDGVEYWNDPKTQMQNNIIYSAYYSSYMQYANNSLESSQIIQNKPDDYFIKAEKETIKLYAKMTQDQKDMLMDVPKMFPSRLIDVPDEI